MPRNANATRTRNAPDKSTTQKTTTTRTRNSRRNSTIELRDARVNELRALRRRNPERIAPGTTDSRVAKFCTRHNDKNGALVDMIDVNDDAFAGFNRDRTQSDGYSTWCKDCERNYNRDVYAPIVAARNAERANDANAKSNEKANAKSGAKANAKATTKANETRDEKTRKISRPADTPVTRTRNTTTNATPNAKTSRNSTRVSRTRKNA